jgi:hypothetical protein
MGTKTITPRSNNDGQIGSSTKYWDKGYFNTLHANTIVTSETGLSVDTVTLASGGLIFEGSVEDTNETSFIATNPTADRIISLPDASGTVALTSDTVTLNGTTANGIATFASSGTLDIEQYITFENSGNISTLSLLSNQDTGDKFTIETTTHGATTFTTVDDNATAADLTLDVDGDITLDADGGNIEFKDGGTSRFRFNLDATPEVDITGNFTLDCTGTVEINADGNSIMFKDGATEIMEVTSSQLNLLSQQGITFEGTPDAHETTLAFTDPTADRTITLPDATGTVQLQGPSTGQIINVSLMKDDNYVLYLNTRTYWYSTAGLTYTGNVNVSAGNWSSWSDDRQARHCGYIASQACKVNKVRFVGLFSTSYSSGALDFEFAIQKWTPGNNTTATVTTTYMTHTDHNGSYTEGSIYNLEFDVSGNNTLAAGDAFTLFARCVDSNASARIQLWYGNCWAEVELT